MTHRTFNPIPGYWYSHNANRLLQVRAKLYVKGKLNSIVLEDINGGRDFITPLQWMSMDLVIHSPVDSWSNTA